MELQCILYEKRGQVGVVTLNQPQKLNAIDTPTTRELAEVFAAMDADPDIRCAVITGAGRAFSAGGDIREESEKNVLDAVDFIETGTKMLDAIEHFRAPVIAALNGYCLGGGTEIAIACDVRVAADNLKMGSPEITLGLLAGWGGTQRMPRIIGLSKAKLWMLTADKYTAERCLEMGAVDMVVPAEKLMEETMALAEKLASQPPMAARYIKKLINDGTQCDMTRALEMEGAMAAHLFATRDNKEACAAFLEKRPHEEFTGR